MNLTKKKQKKYAKKTFAEDYLKSPFCYWKKEKKVVERKRKQNMGNKHLNGKEKFNFN